MSEKPILLASDVHLGSVPAETERAFRRWLEWAGDAASHIVLNGDLFDFWFEYRAAIPRGHTRVLGTLAALVDAGVPVTLMGGNHDWWGGDYLTDEIGVAFLKEPMILDLAGYRTLLAHGDGLGTGDLGYRFLRWVLRSRLTVGGFRALHPDWGAWMSRRVSQTHDRVEGPEQEETPRARHLAGWARARLAEDPSLDLVILGHTHIPVCDEIEPGRWYVNSGDWVHHRTYLRLERGAPPELLEWEGPPDD